MEKNVQISILCEIYSKLLTKKQLEIITDYYDKDLSLSEISENNQITRQAVRDIIKKTENKLFELEESLSLMQKQINQTNTINSIIEDLSQLENIKVDKEYIKIIKDAKEKLQKLVV